MNPINNPEALLLISHLSDISHFRFSLKLRHVVAVNLLIRRIIDTILFVFLKIFAKWPLPVILTLLLYSHAIIDLR